ncbi:MAG: type III-A CRISPR-associated RAMP protein Csm3 [Bacteroidales bacterium]|nr:type III-A CRISPR-associated RAMP protein Csm3 [Bacteroidales bacterium]
MESKSFPKFEANIILKGKIECVTGLHIGGSKEKLEIGGVDSPVIRNPQNRLPYIPGSSLKGKLRSVLEYAMGVVGKDAGEPGDVSHDEKIVRIFGIGADEKESKLKDIGPTRLIIRDAYPDEETVNRWKEMDSELLYTEFKAENSIDRLTSAANPRFIERVVPGSFFNFEMIYGVYRMRPSDQSEINQINEDLDNLLEAMRILEHSTLGKSGSRGYGRIRFHVADPIIVSTEDYKTAGENFIAADADNKSLILKNLKEITIKYQ